ncbi:hypothetical protein ACFFRR_007042 [Megaselia abdita]
MDALKQEIEYMYDDFCDYMRRDTRGVEIAIYGTSSLLLAVAYHKIRPISKFSKASDIPKHFIRDKVKQYGVLKSVEPNPGSPLLMVNHRPPLHFLIPSWKLLPVKLPGISITANGYSWLQTVAVGKKVEFIPVSNKSNDKSAECFVQIVCPENKMALVDVSEALLKLGFAKIEKGSVKDVEFQKYLKSLQKYEEKARTERLGLWTSLPSQPWILKVPKDKLKSLIVSLLPSNRRLPELVR